MYFNYYLTLWLFYNEHHDPDLGTCRYDWCVTPHPVTVDLDGGEETFVGDHADQFLPALLHHFLTEHTYMDHQHMATIV